MKLISLEMKNFRQHLDTRISFCDGVTGIIGPNGAGKSTVLEAVAWALYGAPAVRGTNDTLRSSASQGGAKVSVALEFELGGAAYRIERTLDGSGRTGAAVLQVDGRPLRSGMSEVSEATARLLGMDYKAFFTSFFTGQKMLEFMSQLDGRARSAMISRMLGYDRLTKARERANEDKKGLQREIEGLEKGLADPEELKSRKKDAEEAVKAAAAALETASEVQANAQAEADKLKPAKEASEQKSRRHEEISRRLELDRSDLERVQSRIEQLKAELAQLNAKQKELASLQPDLQRYREAGEEYKKLGELQKHEGERQRLSGRIQGLESTVKTLQARVRQSGELDAKLLKITAVLREAEEQLANAEQNLQAEREKKSAREHTLAAQISHLTSQRQEISDRRERIHSAGADGNCPLCERPLGDELVKVLSSFDGQLSDLANRTQQLSEELRLSQSDGTGLKSLAESREKLAAEVEAMRADKAKTQAQVDQLKLAGEELKQRSEEFSAAQAQLDTLPTGFDQARYSELRKIGDDLKPVRERSVSLRTALERLPTVTSEIEELSQSAKSTGERIAQSEVALKSLAFSADEHQKLVAAYEQASNRATGAMVELERQRGQLQTAEVLLQGAKSAQEAYEQKAGQLKEKRSELAHLQVLADAFDKFRVELNDRIRPELETIASELLAEMTDGRYSQLEINDNYQAFIRDDGELKQVISGGEDDIVNLALRLAISQMIADRAGQPFSLLVLDEVFGSLDEVRRDNVVELLQNLKHRFEQIVVITHVEAIHDMVDNCLMVEFDERTKTSRLRDRSEEIDPAAVGVI